MSFPFHGGMPNGGLPPPSMMAGVPMLSAPGFDMHRGFGTPMPGLNDAPLDFDINKGAQPVSASPSEFELRPASAALRRRHNEDERQRRDRRDPEDGESQLTEAPPPQPQPHPVAHHVYGGMGVYGLGGPISMVGGMMMDPSALQYAMMPGRLEPQPQPQPQFADPGATLGDRDPHRSGAGGDFGLLPAPTVVKEPVRLKTCTLLPPPPNSAPPATRERPPGCRTVFVGGLPENVTEEVLTEIFERCGQITSLRLSRKNFCHIRFAYEQSVDGAVYLSGYRVRLDDKTDPGNCAKLHVDYAQARDDKHEWECKQRALQRAARHMERLATGWRLPSPPVVSHYSDHEAAATSEKIKQDDSFIEAVQVVIAWLERGECNKKNVNMFYSMIQSTNSHVRRLLNEKTQYDEEVQRAKDEAKLKMQGILNQFSQVEKVFAAASHKKVWDHFTKAQRKNIDMWKKQSSEIRSIQLEDFLQDSCGGEEMDCSDTDDVEGVTLRKRSKSDADAVKEENDNLRCQLEAYTNEIHLLKTESQAEICKNNEEIRKLREQTSHLEIQLAQAKRAQMSESVKVLAMEAKLNAKEKSNASDKSDFAKINDEKVAILTAEDKEKIDHKESFSAMGGLSDREAKLIGIISTFLHIHPFGASTDYVWSYVQKLEPQISPNQVEDVLRRYPTVFIQEMSGVGANIERKWVFNGLKCS